MYGAWVTPTGEILPVVERFGHWPTVRDAYGLGTSEALDRGFVRLVFDGGELGIEYGPDPSVEQVHAIRDAIERHFRSSWKRGAIERFTPPLNHFERVSDVDDVVRYFLRGQNPSRIAAIRNNPAFI